MSPEGLMAAAALIGSFGLGGGGLWVALANRPEMNAKAKATDATGETSVSADARAWAEFHSRETQEAKAEARDAIARARAAEDRAEAAEDRMEVAEERAESCEIRVTALEHKLGQVVEHVGVLNEQIVELGGHPSPPPESLIPPLKRP